MGYLPDAVRALTTDDIDGCLSVAEDRNWVTSRSQWETLLRFGRGYGFDAGGALGGTVTIFAYRDFAFVGMLLVRKRIEGVGWGRRLVEGALATTGGLPAALFATDLGLPLYTKMGFSKRELLATHAGIWSGPTGLVHVYASNAITPAQIESITQADALAVGTPRPQLLAMLLASPARIAIAGRGTAYAIARDRAGETVIGPVIAPDDDTATALIASLTSSGTQTRIHIFANKPGLRERLCDFGLAAVKELPLLARGSVALPPVQWYGVATKATG